MRFDVYYLDYQTLVLCVNGTGIRVDKVQGLFICHSTAGNANCGSSMLHEKKSKLWIIKIYKEISGFTSSIFLGFDSSLWATIKPWCKITWQCMVKNTAGKKTNIFLHNIFLHKVWKEVYWFCSCDSHWVSKKRKDICSRIRLWKWDRFNHY